MRRRGYFGVGIEHTKNATNVGTLWRSAANMGASFVFTIGRRYRHQASDTVKAFKHIPLYHYDSVADFYAHLPHDCILIGVELDERASSLPAFAHPERAVYLLGPEDGSLSPTAVARCHRLVQIPSALCLNVSVAGSIVIYDRNAKRAAA